MRVKIFIFALIFQMISCNENKNPFKPLPYVDGVGKMLLTTEKKNYSWQKSESNFIIIIEGTLKNMSSNTYYSHIGNGYGPPEQDKLLFAKYSAGGIEKYDKSNSLWTEVHILGQLIEGSKTIPIKPNKNYSFYAHLNLETNDIEKGQYRLRIEYYENPDFKNTEIIYRDYSNVFEIK